MNKKESEIYEFINNLQNPIKLHTNKKYNNPWINQNNYNNLLTFLLAKQNAKYILIGEAPGRKGCLQCGVPFCDDYTLEKLVKIDNNKIKKSKETSAQRIYYAFEDNFIAWNAFPYQPCDEYGNNRPPSIEELKFGNEYLKKFLNIFYSKNKEIILIGNKAEYACKNFKIEYKKIIHPSCYADNKRKELKYEYGLNGWLKYINSIIPDLKINNLQV
uniref:uracil-DNA glycosylase family protein n=1 Tax=Candidatus Stercorousia sp. TaxID=3048886 RepID=UPI0040271F69